MAKRIVKEDLVEETLDTVTPEVCISEDEALEAVTPEVYVPGHNTRAFRQ